jgi:hypothetical protein
MRLYFAFSDYIYELVKVMHMFVFDFKLLFFNANLLLFII